MISCCCLSHLPPPPSFLLCRLCMIWRVIWASGLLRSGGKGWGGGRGMCSYRFYTGLALFMPRGLPSAPSTLSAASVLSPHPNRKLAARRLGNTVRGLFPLFLHCLTSLQTPLIRARCFARRRLSRFCKTTCGFRRISSRTRCKWLPHPHPRTSQTKQTSCYTFTAAAALWLSRQIAAGLRRAAIRSSRELVEQVECYGG